MKSLQEFIHLFFEDETNIKLRRQIIDYVNPDKKSEEINDISDKSLKKAYQILQKIDQNDFDEIKKLYQGNLEGLKNLINILENTGQKSEFLKSLLKKDGFPTFKDLQSHTNLYDLCKDKKFKFSEIFDDSQLNDFLKQLLTITYKVSGKGVGAGELFLTTLFQNTEHPNQGDVKIENNEIEVKFSTTFSSNGGRILPAKGTLKTVDEITTEFERIIKEKGIEIPEDITRNNNDCIMIAGQQYIDNIVDKLQNKFDNKNEIYKLLAQMYFYQFNNLRNYKDKFIKFINTIKNYSYDTLIKIHGSLALISYHEADKWNYLLIGVSKTADYCIINGEDCTIDNLNQLVNNKQSFVFKKYPSNTNGAHPMQDKVCQIYVAKNR
jgi:hypothetical protein